MAGCAALALERMDSTIVATLNNDTECITAVHCLKVQPSPVTTPASLQPPSPPSLPCLSWAKAFGARTQIYLQRLAVDLGDGEAVRRAAGCAFALATQALAELPLLQYPPSLAAAAVLVAARKAQVRPYTFLRSIMQMYRMPC